MSITLILGGARSGKSSHGEKLALALSKNPIYLATSRIWDDDHRARIERHIRDRGDEWRRVEEEKILSVIAVENEVILVDCVTLWLTNFFLDAKQDEELALTNAKKELDSALLLKNDWIFVSNELGQGLHAPTQSGRKFTDIQGFMNQYIAARADNVILMVAGIPLRVK